MGILKMRRLYVQHPLVNGMIKLLRRRVATTPASEPVYIKMATMARSRSATTREVAIDARSLRAC